ncbi:phage tail assembly chaperone G [Cytobacillus firmus]|uniref:phage tail assembly chaperone G n=1 Tax=Cytobacillus firmus TaxID=1399 RepID=UPI0018CD5AD7|nr:hypothetical protein [Cytobacillus firmus]MBG9657095.1 hypothetical protein [Cytobacillus firmus]MED1906769.1 hypothetical protein [Cytobacillus firmus]
MKIELLEKVYVAPRPKARLFREALVITQERDLNNITPDVLDDLLQYVCDAFGNQFTIDDIYDGYASTDLIDLVTETIVYVIGDKATVEGKKK